jgi:hypothetical protein
VVGRRGVGVISFISNVCRGRLAQIAGGAALAAREKQDRANAADENQDCSAREDGDSEKRRSKAHQQTRQMALDTYVSLSVALNSTCSRLFPPQGPKLCTNPCESVNSL